MHEHQPSKVMPVNPVPEPSESSILPGNEPSVLSCYVMGVIKSMTDEPDKWLRNKFRNNGLGYRFNDVEVCQWDCDPEQPWRSSRNVTLDFCSNPTNSEQIAINTAYHALAYYHQITKPKLIVQLFEKKARESFEKMGCPSETPSSLTPIL